VPNHQIEHSYSILCGRLCEYEARGAGSMILQHCLQREYLTTISAASQQLVEIDSMYPCVSMAGTSKHAYCLGPACFSWLRISHMLRWMETTWEQMKHTTCRPAATQLACHSCLHSPFMLDISSMPSTHAAYPHKASWVLTPSVCTVQGWNRLSHGHSTPP